MIKKSILFIILVSAICISGLTLAKSGKPFSAKIEFPFRVVDDSGKPVYQANVDGYFWCPYTSNAAGDAFNEDTDTNGYCIVKGRGYAYIEGEVTKPGYYKTHYKISLGNVNQARKTKKWSLEKTKVILREKKNPIPMYAKNVRANVPGTNEWYGYDFMVGDWVKPYGKGKVNDMQVKIYDMLDGVLGNWKLWHKKLIISFNANHFDGVELFNRKNWSQYTSPYNAPKSGYIKTLESEFKRTPDKILLDTMIKEEKCLVFRSRSMTDEEGNLKQANYGKIYGPIDFGVTREKETFLNFTYYFNPTPNDRNLEYAPGKNLLKGLSSLEKIKMYNCP